MTQFFVLMILLCLIEGVTDTGQRMDGRTVYVNRASSSGATALDSATIRQPNVSICTKSSIIIDCRCQSQFIFNICCRQWKLADMFHQVFSCNYVFHVDLITNSRIVLSVSCSTCVLFWQHPAHNLCMYTLSIGQTNGVKVIKYFLHTTFLSGLCQLSSHLHICAQYSSPSAHSKFPGACCNSLNTSALNSLHWLPIR